LIIVFANMVFANMVFAIIIMAGACGSKRQNVARMTGCSRAIAQSSWHCGHTSRFRRAGDGKAAVAHPAAASISLKRRPNTKPGDAPAAAIRMRAARLNGFTYRI